MHEPVAVESMVLNRLVPGVVLMLALAGSGCAQTVSVVTTGADADTGTTGHVQSGGDAAIGDRLAEVMQQGKDSAEAFRAAGNAAGLRTDGHGVLVDVLTRGLSEGDEARFDVPGASMVSFSPKYQRVTLSVATPAVVHRIAGIAVVRRIEAAVGATTFGISD